MAIFFNPLWIMENSEKNFFSWKSLTLFLVYLLNDAKMQRKKFRWWGYPHFRSRTLFCSATKLIFCISYSHYFGVKTSCLFRTIFVGMLKWTLFRTILMWKYWHALLAPFVCWKVKLNPFLHYFYVITSCLFKNWTLFSLLWCEKVDISYLHHFWVEG